MIKPPFSFDMVDELRLLCQLGKDAVFAMLAGRHGFTIFNDGTDSRYAFRQGSTPVLGVAHADTVLNADTFTFDDNAKVVSPELDDRLGIWTLLHGLPSLGISDYSILITDFEEIGMSTARDFVPPTSFNWMFQFDRRGTGVVNYEYSDDGVFDGLLTSCFGTLHNGSFSDICSLSHLGVKGFNVGTAYYNEHTQGCWADLKQLRKQMKSFVKFFKSFASWKLEHSPATYSSRDDWYFGYSTTRRTKKRSKTTTASIGFSAQATRTGCSVECASCLETFLSEDCLELRDGSFLCNRCEPFFRSDLRDDDILR